MNWSHQTSPLKDALRDPEQFPLQTHVISQLDEVCVQRIWSKVDTRPATVQNKAERFSLSGNGIFALASAALFILAFMGTTSFWDQRAALRLEAGVESHELQGTIHAPQSSRVLSFEDGSRIEMNRGAALRILSNEGRDFVTKLNEGRARFSVEPGGQRRWIVEAGDVSVEVVGTVFTVERKAQGTLVSVERGTVIVSGSVPDGKVTLTRGMHVESRRLLAAQSAQIAESNDSNSRESNEAENEAEPADSSISLNDLIDEVPEPSTSALQQNPGNASANEGADEKGEDAVARLLAQGDVARRNRDLGAAAEAYSSAAQIAAPQDARGAMASLSFAKVSSDPAAVMRLLKSGLPAMPPSLREPALARLVRACQRAGRPQDAAAFASQYKKEFPTGPRLKLVRSWAAQP